MSFGNRTARGVIVTTRWTRAAKFAAFGALAMLGSMAPAASQTVPDEIKSAQKADNSEAALAEKR